MHHHDEARLGDPSGGERRVVGEHLALVDQHHLGSRDLLRLGELGADVPDGRVVREVLLELLVGAAGWVSRDGDSAVSAGAGWVGSRDAQISCPRRPRFFCRGGKNGEDLGGSARFTRASARREPSSPSLPRFARCADARARRAAPSRRRRARVAPDLSPRSKLEPASINNGRERFGLGAHSVLKATFMALETGAGSLAGVVLEARGVWPVERSPYASALANGGARRGKTLKKRREG